MLNRRMAAWRIGAIGALATVSLLSAAQVADPSAHAARVPVRQSPPAIEYYARYPLFQRPVLSPNGQHLAVVVPIRNRMNLAVVDLHTKASKVLTSIERYDVFDARWVGNDYLIFSMGTLNAPSGSDAHDGGGLFMVSRDGSESRGLAPTVREIITGNSDSFWYHRIQPLGTVPGSSSEIFVSEYRRTKDAADVYKLNVTTGRRELVTADRPAGTYRYVLDLNMVPRVAMARELRDSDKTTLWYRDSATSPWRELLTYERGTAMVDGRSSRLSPVGFDDDNKHLLVTSNDGRDTTGLFRFDVDARKVGEMIAAHPTFDVDQVVRHPGTRKVIGIRVDAEQPTVAWFDQTQAQRQATVDKALPGRINELLGTGDNLVVHSFDDVSSPVFYVYDTKARKLEKALESMPWIKPGHYVPMRPFTLKTRDGLAIPSYYFLPAGYKPGDKALPTVLHIHGGPHAKADSWGPGWNGGFGVAEAQFLASRGYAVVLPNFRITPGLGKRIYLAGRHAIGRQMSEDHEDAAKWAVDQGFADPARMCITGASYGGYATLQALVKTPDLFKCGIAGLPVSDLERQLTSTYGDTYLTTTGQAFWRHFIIGENSEKGTARSISPAHHADRVKAPVLFYAGSADRRTPLEQTTIMADALRKAGHQPEVIVKTEEAHGYAVLENRVDLWERMAAFLEKHIGKGSSTRP